MRSVNGYDRFPANGEQAQEEGQGLVEYAVIILFVVIALIGSLIATATDINQVYNSIIQVFATLI